MGRGMAASRILRASLGLFFFLTPLWAWQSGVPAASQATDPPAREQAHAASHSTKLPEEYRQWLNEEVPYLISDRERDEFQALLTDAERQRFIERFWRLRDPDPSTEANEFRSQHLQRVRQANDKFSEGVPGWKTARGRVWIMHGPPDSIHFDVGGSMLELKIFRPTEVLAENSSVYKTPFARISLEMPDSEVWVYHHLEGARHFPGTFEVVFSRANRTGLWSAAQQLGRLGSGQAQSYTNRLQRDKAIARFRQENVSVGRYEVVYAGPHRYGSVEQLYRAIFTPSLAYRFNVNEVILGVRDLDESRGNVLERRMALRKRLRESVESQVYFQRFDMEVRTGAVRAGGGRTSLPVSISLDPSLAGDTLEFLIELLGPDREPVAHVVDRVLLPQPSPGDAEGGSPREFLYQTRLEARPGRYQLAVYATLEERKAAAFHNSAVELPDFSGPALSVSEVLLFRDVVRRSEDGQDGSLPVRFLGGSRPPALRDFYLIPSADSRFRRRDNLTAFVEVYNPSLPDGAHPDIDLVCRFWQGDRLVATVPSKSLDYLTEAGGDRRTAYGISFPLRRFTPGRYRIELEVQDRRAGLSRTKSADFLIR
ncbi:MAG TPA: GWxTD domain-containing protein [Acidobacteriota bacterium]|nr:GWxTD domain-containing protein [Acidobacteriota bacterium]